MSQFLGTIRRWVNGGPGNRYGTGSILLDAATRNSPPESRAPSPESRVPEAGVIGLTGTAALGGWLRDLGEYNSKLQPPTAFTVYEKMRRSDGDVAAVLDACMLPIRAAEYQILPGIEDEKDSGYARAKEIAEFVEDNLFGGLEYEVTGLGTRGSGLGRKVRQSFESVLENALLMLPFGCAAHEVIWRMDSDAVRIAHFAPRLPSTFSRFFLGEDGESLLELEQQGYRGDKYERVRLPADRLDFFSFAREGANWWGRSLLRRAYKHWYLKEHLEVDDGIACERNGMGVPTFEQPDNASKEDRDLVAAWGRNLSLHEQLFVSLPFGWKFSLKGVEGRPREILPSIRYHSEMIVRSVLATFLAFGTTQTGARALGESATDFFKLALEGTAWLIAETMTNGSIRQLVDYNFGGSSLVTRHLSLPYPRLSFANIMATAPYELWKTVKELVDGGVIVPDDDLEAAGREDLGLPVKAEPRTVAGLGTGEPGLGPRDSGLGKDGNQKANGKGQKTEVQASDSSLVTRHLSLADATSRASRRELKVWEAKVDYDALRRRQDTTGKKVARILRAAKAVVVRQAARMVAQTPTLDLQRLALPTDMNVLGQIERAVTPAFQYGGTSVLRERLKATGRRSNVPAQMLVEKSHRRGTESAEKLRVSAVNLADHLARAKNAPRLVVEATWADFANWLSPRAIAAAVDARKRGLEGGAIEEAVNAALEDAPDGGLDRIGMEAGRGALAGGRYATLADFDSEISRYIRTEADDDRVCEVCNAADGTEWESLDEVDWQPGDDCLGGDLCRGQLVAVFADEGTVTAE